MTRTAFVAGATGYVGREVVRRLAEEGVATTAHLRADSGSAEAWRGRFEKMGATVAACPWESAALSEALTAAAPSLVFALLGTTRRRARAEEIAGDPYDKIDYGLTAMLYEAASKLSSKPRFIYLSAVGVKENARGAYMRARVRAEKLITEGTLPYVIARPAIISGPDRDEERVGERVMGKALDGALSVLGALGAKTIQSRYRSTTNAILAEALVRLALESEGEGVIAEGDDLRPTRK